MKRIVFALAMGLPTGANAQEPTPPPASEDTPNIPAVPTPTGPYMKSCKDPMMKDGILYATCLQPDKTRRQARLQLPCAGKIENKAGALVCAK